MIVMTVADFKSRFSEVVDLVEDGKEIAVSFGRSKRIIGYFSKESKSTKTYSQKRQLGILADGHFELSDDFKMTPEELGMVDDILD